MRPLPPIFDPRILSILLTGLLLIFQNCSPVGSIENNDSSNGAMAIGPFTTIALKVEGSCPTGIAVDDSPMANYISQFCARPFKPGDSLAVEDVKLMNPGDECPATHQKVGEVYPPLIDPQAVCVLTTSYNSAAHFVMQLYEKPTVEGCRPGHAIVGFEASVAKVICSAKR